jgi:hypothetical protein
MPLSQQEESELQALKGQLQQLSPYRGEVRSEPQQLSVNNPYANPRAEAPLEEVAYDPIDLIGGIPAAKLGASVGKAAAGGVKELGKKGISSLSQLLGRGLSGAPAEEVAAFKNAPQEINRLKEMYTSHPGKLSEELAGDIAKGVRTLGEKGKYQSNALKAELVGRDPIKINPKDFKGTSVEGDLSSWIRENGQEVTGDIDLINRNSALASAPTEIEVPPAKLYEWKKQLGKSAEFRPPQGVVVPLEHVAKNQADAAASGRLKSVLESMPEVGDFVKQQNREMAERARFGKAATKMQQTPEKILNPNLKTRAIVEYVGREGETPLIEKALNLRTSQGKLMAPISAVNPIKSSGALAGRTAIKVGNTLEGLLGRVPAEKAGQIGGAVAGQQLNRGVGQAIRDQAPQQQSGLSPDEESELEQLKSQLKSLQ